MTCLILAFGFLFDDAHAQANHFMPAEYEAQSAVCVGYEMYFEMEFLAICKALDGKIKVNIIAGPGSNKEQIFQLLQRNHIDTTFFTYILLDENRIWIRDHGPTLLKTENDSLMVADFNWNMYGAQYWLENKYGSNSKIAFRKYQAFHADVIGKMDVRLGQRFGAKALSTDVVMEGGSIEVNGKGTLILCEEVTLNRNPKLSKPYIESELNRLLGTRQTIWLEQGLLEDPHWFQQIHENYFGFGTFGHTDEFVRFANDSTILLAWVDEAEKDLNYFNQENYRRMSRNLETIQQFKDHRGKPFHVVKVPLPNLITTKAIVSQNTTLNPKQEFQSISVDQFPKMGMKNIGDTISWVAASSYLNYLVTPKVVVLPDYSMYPGAEKKQEQVKALFSQLFPGREILFVDVMKLNFMGGGIHCVTQQVPE